MGNLIMQRDMPKHVEHGCLATLLTLMGEEVLRHLLNGHCFSIGAGLSVLFRSDDGDEDGRTVRRIDALEDKAKDVFYPLCKYFRQNCKYDGVCQQFDREVALRYYKAEWNGPKLYRCPLQLWDMTYPLCVRGSVIGVLLNTAYNINLLYPTPLTLSVEFHTDALLSDNVIELIIKEYFCFTFPSFVTSIDVKEYVD